MRDPVILPSSKTIIDRSTIKQHFLSDPTDPFNRQPLKWEDIIDATELKEEITSYMEQRKKGKVAVGDSEVAMVIGEGVKEGEGEGEKMQVD